MDDLVTRSLRASARTTARTSRNTVGQINAIADELARALGAGQRVLIIGNGGSAADAQHLAAEFVGRFRHDRQPLPALALTTDTSALTAIANDYGFEHVFARQVEALGRPGDVLLALSTSGKSENVLRAAESARRLGLTVIAFTDIDGGELARQADIAVRISTAITARTQESTMAALHAVCLAVEERLGVGGSRVADLLTTDFDHLPAAVSLWRSKGMRVGFAVGDFASISAEQARRLTIASDKVDVMVALVEDTVAHSGTAFDLPERVALAESIETIDHVVALPGPALDTARQFDADLIIELSGQQDD